jgi:hypothetical protein
VVPIQFLAVAVAKAVVRVVAPFLRFLARPGLRFAERRGGTGLRYSFVLIAGVILPGQRFRRRREFRVGLQVRLGEGVAKGRVVKFTIAFNLTKK